jgi:soluble lytic murein transglycosylase-like protein
LLRFLHRFAVVAVAAQLFGCSASTSDGTLSNRLKETPDIARVINGALSWPAPAQVDALLGACMIEDGPPVSSVQLAIARAILRTNPRVTAIGSLMLAGTTVRAARDAGIPPAFLAATLLQESAYDVSAVSSAGAVGVAQFEIETADDYGVHPFSPRSAIPGAASLLASYLRDYAERSDPYALALSAYNAGPGAVARYGGVPPYAETREYIALIRDRWGRIASYMRRSAAK